MAIKIFIDQGHNPTNPNAGAEGQGLREQDLVYEIGVLTADLLRQNPNFEVRLSRNSPDEILGTTVGESLASRVSAANSWGADYFISLHANASTIPSASGNEAYVYSYDSPAFEFAQSISSFTDDFIQKRYDTVFGIFDTERTAEHKIPPFIDAHMDKVSRFCGRSHFGSGKPDLKVIAFQIDIFKNFSFHK